MRASSAEKRSTKTVTSILGGTLLLVLCWWLFSGDETTVDYDTLSNRDGQAYAPGETRPFTGTATGMFANGKMRIEVNFVDGLEHGLKVVWYQEGKKQSEGMLKKGRYEGKLTTWFPNGQKEKEAIYQNGEETSRQQWDENGNPVE